MNVSLPKHLEEFIVQQVRDGRFGSRDEVVVTALRQMEESERQREMEAFKAAFRRFSFNAASCHSCSCRIRAIRKICG